MTAHGLVLSFRPEGTPVERRLCGARIELCPEYADAALMIPGDLPPGDPDEIDTALRCLLEAHGTGPHYGIVRTLLGVYKAEVWACWHDGQQPSGVVTLPDCRAVSGNGDEGCVLFDKHPGGHGWEIADPEHDALRARLGLL